MEQATAVPPGTVNLSTTLDPGTVPQESGGGAPKLPQNEPPKAEKGISIRDALVQEKARLDAENADEPAKAKEPEKAAKKPAEKDEKTAAKGDEAEKPAKSAQAAEEPAGQREGRAQEPVARTGQEGAERSRSSEERQQDAPPARFLPESRQNWYAVPREIKADMHRIVAEMESENEGLKASHERYEPLRQFDDIARSNGRELKDSLAKVVQIEQALARDLFGGLDMILKEIGPRQADGSAVSLMDVARYMVQNEGQFANRSAAPSAAHDPRVDQLSREVESLRAERVNAQISQVQPVIDAFAAQHPDFRQLEPQVVRVLNSGLIEEFYGTGLPLEKRLAEAYRIAGGSPSSGRAAQAIEQPSGDDGARVKSDAGTKSIRGAPSGGEDAEPEPRKTSIRDLLRAEMRKAG